MKTAVILAAGQGKKLWPYASCRPKAMIPVSNQPVIEIQVNMLLALGITQIFVVAASFSEQIRHHLRNVQQVKVIDAPGSKGTADSLSRAAEFVQDDCLVLYGDVLCEQSDLRHLLAQMMAGSRNEVLVAPLTDESPSDHICCQVSHDQVTAIMGHPRDRFAYRFVAFCLKKAFFSYLDANSGVFSKLDVGVMPTQELHLELSLMDSLADGHAIGAVITEGKSVDIDKPWHILLANHIRTMQQCQTLTGSQLAEQASIDPSAKIDGHVVLGKGSRIGYHVVIKGNVIIGDNTLVENGAIIGGNVMIGSNCYIGNYCFVDSETTIGNHCVVNHCAEISGTIMDGVYLYHYMEIDGLVGRNSDIGAATVCGTLRFDDGSTTHRVQGRRETPPAFANATYIGDYCRTGVNATIMPGCKTGIYSIVGPGVVLKEDLPDRTLIQTEQQLVKKTWGPEKYGW